MLRRIHTQPNVWMHMLLIILIIQRVFPQISKGKIQQRVYEVFLIVVEEHNFSQLLLNFVCTASTNLQHSDTLNWKYYTEQNN